MSNAPDLRTHTSAPRPARVIVALVASALAWSALSGTPAAAANDADPASVIFIGDSVTAGFGYFGGKENASGVTGKVNDAFPSSWYFGDNSLSDCSPPDSGTPDDRCSNNNLNGQPWNAGPWQPGAGAPDVAYSYQIAAKQDPTAKVPVENWAITGSTPGMWDSGGPFNDQLRTIRNTHVVMTLGANPILASFLRVKLAYKTVTDGACADSTEWLGWTGWWAYPPAHVVECANQQWAQHDQSAHLQGVYKTLLRNNNKVLVMGYYRACAWSFGTWQPEGNLDKGPAAGKPCPSQKQKVSECAKCAVTGTTSQWEQAVAAEDAINAKIQAAVAAVQQWAAQQPGVAPTDIQYVLPDASAWAEHQAWSSDSWVFQNDTWIHPSKAGHAQLAQSVIEKMCQSFGQWCGSPPRWEPRPAPREARIPQRIKGSVPKRMRTRSLKPLPTLTRQANPLSWTSRTPKLCRLFSGDLVSGRKAGTCRITAVAFRSGSAMRLRERHTVRIR